MGKRIVEFRDCMSETMKAFDENRVLMVTQAPKGLPNAMAIGWGTIGVVWRRPVFIVLVRPQRYTYTLTEQTGEFTVNIAPPELKEVVEYCGTVSGRDHDKFKEKKLTAIPSLKVKTPLIKECKIHFECQVLYKDDLMPQALDRTIVSLIYPQADFHRIYFGEILACQCDF